MARIEQSIEVNAPARLAYEQLTRFEQYPRFMQDVQEVRKLDGNRLYWRGKAGNADVEWDAEITQQVPDSCIAWRNLNGPRHEGRIVLAPVEQGRTRVVLVMECEPEQLAPSGHADADGSIAGRTEQDMVRFKHFIEKLARDSGQWGGREQEAVPSHSAPAELAAGGLDGVPQDHGIHPALDSQADQPDAPQQPYGADEADNAKAAPRQDGTPLPWLSGFMQTWDPLATMRRVSDGMEQMLGRLPSAARGTGAADEEGAGWTPPVEIIRGHDKMIVCAELPGVPRDAIQIDIHAGHLQIEGSRLPRPPSAPDEQRSSERRYGRFHRRLSLPADADTAGVSAVLKDGLLEVVVPLRQDGQPRRRIEISGDD